MVSSDNAVTLSAKYLLDKNPGSQVVMWQPNDAKDPSKGGRFALVEWIVYPGGQLTGFVFKTTGIPPRSIPIEALPHGGRIQVVGHGSINEASNKITLNGMDALQLSAALKSLPIDGTAGAIKRVSLAGCNVGALDSEGTAFLGDGFPEVLLRDMRSTVDEVSSRTGLVHVDTNGRKLYGELTAEGTVWRPKPGTITKTVIGLDDSGKVYRLQEKISQAPETLPNPAGSSETVRTTGGGIELEDTGAAINPKHVKLNNDDLFDVISSVAKEHFQAVPEDPNWKTRVEKERLVRVLDQGVPKDKKIKIREFSSYAELTQEIKQWGEKGFEFPSYDKNTNTWTTTDSTGEPFADKYIYYRYGDCLQSKSSIWFAGEGIIQIP